MHQMENDQENPNQLVLSKAIDRLSRARDTVGPLRQRNAISPTSAVSRKFPYSSPVTELAANFDELTGLDGTPRRRLSLSSSGTPTPVRDVQQLPRRIADQADDGVADIENAQPAEEVHSNRERGSRLNYIRRIKSLPAFNDSPMLVADVPTFSLGSPDLPTASQSATTRWPLLSKGSRSFDAAADVSCGRGVDVHIRPPSSASDDSSWSQSSQDSQDSGLGRFTRGPVVPTTMWQQGHDKVMVPVALSAKEAACSISDSAKYRGESLLALGNSPALSDILEDAAVDNSPLLRSKLCSADDEDSCDPAADDGFRDTDTAVDHVQDVPVIPCTLSGLLNAPLVHLPQTISKVNVAASDIRNVAAMSQHRRSLFRRFATCSVAAGRDGLGPKVPEEATFEVRRRCREATTDRAKRPDSCGPTTPASSKRRRSSEPGEEDMNQSSVAAKPAAGPADTVSEAVATCSNSHVAGTRAGKLQRCQSMFEHPSLGLTLCENDSALQLTGDLVTRCCLPLIAGKHQDLRCISPGTVASLVRQEFSHIVESFHIVDCRYPYEFLAGHIQGAINIHKKDDLADRFLKQPLVPVTQQYAVDAKRKIIVFHCEFSSERAPRLSRFLRNVDRKQNMDLYPGLYYPELYLLEGGYKAFFENFQELCEPRAYKPMLHPDHGDDLRKFRSKAKTWTGYADEKARQSGLRSGVRM